MEEKKNTLKEIEIIAQTCKTKEGKAFTSFKAFTKDGKKVSLHFKQEDEDGKKIVMPSSSCIMVIDANYLQYTTAKKYPELWVKGQPEYKEKEFKNSAILDELF